ncbi:MAG TPA: DUF3017 domain-containing protein [Pseudonocardiaceae bacterium]|nr:DUF3017 domain-containing protein [Pseudonocardiaceae bacterium]
MSDQVVESPERLPPGDPQVTRPSGPGPRSRLRSLVRLVRANLPYAVVMLVMVLGFLRIVENHWRQGSTLVGGSLLLAALLRALLPENQTGLIVVRRSRVVDVLTYAALGACMVFVSLTIQGGPFDR